MYFSDDKKRKRLRDAMDKSRRLLKPFRDNRVDFIKQYVGSHYSDDGARDRVPVNLIELATNIYARQLSAKSPKVLVATYKQEIKPKASLLELAINHLLSEIWFDKTMRMVVLDALFGVGIIKVGMYSHGKVEVDGFTHDVGQPFADAVHLDDWVHDMSARRYDEVQFAGNRYRLPLEYVQEAEEFDKKARQGLKATRKGEYDRGESGDSADSISQGDTPDKDEYVDFVELWDLWLPMENLVITLPCGGGAPLREIEWEGPEPGPFHMLGFSEVPNNIMPLPPASLWLDLHDLSNRIFRKLGRQGERQKTILGIQDGAARDGELIVKAEDGDAIRMDNPGQAREYRFGGIDQPNMAFFLQLVDKFSYMNGNLDSLGGLSPQAQTLGQDEMLARSASKRVADMQDRVEGFVTNVIKSLAFYLWNDPLINLPLVKRMANTDISVPVRFTPEDREGDFLDYNIEIEPYSMQHESPGTRLQTINGLMNNVLMPLAGPMAQQGIQVNFEGLLKLIAKYSNMPEVSEIITFVGQQATMPPQGADGGQVAPAQPPVTTRNYVRTNRPGASRSGKDYAMMQTLLGKMPQPNEMAAMARPVG